MSAFAQGIGSIDTPHPDADLLALCHRLQDMQAEWQRLYDATSDTDELDTEADFAWKLYSNNVWPAEVLAVWDNREPDPADMPARLRLLRATTAEGMRAKASAILALEESYAYCDCRDDAWELMRSLLQDVAGIETHNLGADAAKGVMP